MKTDPKDHQARTLWDRLLLWLRDEEPGRISLPQQAPKTGTDTEILLSLTDRQNLESAMGSPLNCETSFYKTETEFRAKSSPPKDGLII